MRDELRRRPPEDRERLAATIAARMDAPITAAGVLFLLVVLAGTVARPGTAVARAMDVVAWVLWLAFVAEFVVRAVVAPSAVAFLRRNWWQLVFLALPFLRFARVLARLARVGRVLSAAVRSGRSAGKKLSGRLAWLSVVTAIVILSASQLLYEFAGFQSYAAALHAAAMATITGEPIGRPDAAAQLLEVVLALYSVVVFASLAGMLGAFFLERPVRRDDDPAALPPPR